MSVELSLHHDLASIESDWRAFEASADCTVFQTFDWLSTWFRNIGVHEGAKPAIVIGRHEGAILFLLPFALEAQRLRSQDHLARLVSVQLQRPGAGARFFAAREPGAVRPGLAGDSTAAAQQLGHDLVDLEKMPKIIGEQANPFCALRVTPHVNDAYLTTLGGDWETYYAAKRSSSTRKTDRKKRKRLADHGEIRFVTAGNRDDVVRSVDALIDEKRRSYAKLGVANMFERPGYRDFFLDLATGSQSSRLTHVSRLDVGEMTAAANFGLMFRGRYYYILAGYDDGELARFGPGALQLRDVMRYAARARLQRVRFHHRRRTLQARVVRHRDQALRLRRAGVACAAGVARLDRGVPPDQAPHQAQPAAWALVRKARSMMGSLRR